MRINDAYKNPQVTPATVKSTGAASRGQGSAPARASRSEGKESVSLSISSQARALATASANTGFDVEKVEELKGLVERGEFKVDPQKIADKIVNESSQ